MQDKTQVIVYENGDIIRVSVVQKLLLDYWKLSTAERKAFERLFKKPGLESESKKFYENLKHK